MSKYPTSSSDDAASISNQPLIPKAPEPKDYEAAVAVLMTSYGFSGGMQPTPTPPKKKNKKKGSTGGTSKKKSDGTTGNKANQSSEASSPKTSSKK